MHQVGGKQHQIARLGPDLLFQGEGTGFENPPVRQVGAGIEKLDHAGIAAFDLGLRHVIDPGPMGTGMGVGRVETAGRVGVHPGEEFQLQGRWIDL